MKQLFSTDPLARWIDFAQDTSFGSGAVGTALYAIPFNVATPAPLAATLSFSWAVDDTTGDQDVSGNFGPNPWGLYLNETPLIVLPIGSFAQEQTISIPISVMPGSNTLNVYQRDLGQGVSGVIFSATITVVPEPGTLSLLLLGGLRVLRRARRELSSMAGATPVK